MTCIDDKYYEYLDYLYKCADIRFPDCRDTDSIVQETLLTLFVYEQNGKTVEHPKGFLSSVLTRKYNDYLRSKYKNETVSFGGFDIPDIKNEDHSEEYESVRREIGRLIKIYREVTILYYVHGKSVNEIATKLGIPKGTVLSRLDTARKQVKEGIENMEKYSDISYEPKHLTLGIRGTPGLGAEPFSLVTSRIEENILILAYQNPISVKGIADTMGMPCAYLEPIIERLVLGELMGKSKGGLVYTRCFIQGYRDSLGNTEKQKQASDKHARDVWKISSKHILNLLSDKMDDKQKVTFILYMLERILTRIIQKISVSPDRPERPPERPNGGSWLASAKYFDSGEKPIDEYETSGPFCCSLTQGDRYIGRMYDYQSFWGNTQYAYRRFKYNCSPTEIFAFLCSFVDESVKPQNTLIYELCADFADIGILRRNESKDKKYSLDIPYISTNDYDHALKATEKAAEELYPILENDLTKLLNTHINKVPKHVDEYRHYRHSGGLGAYIPLQLRAIIDQGLLPFPVKIGKTPIMLLALEV